MRETDSTLSLDDGLTLEIGEYSYIHDRAIRNPSGALTHIRIGKFCSIATDLTIIGYDHHHEWITTYPFLDDAHRACWPGTEGIPYPQASQFGSNKSRGDITIGNDVWVGYNVKLFKGITIGNGAVIGACSLVNKPVEPYTIVAGTPARPIRKRFTDAEISALERISWWDWPAELINLHMPFLCSSNIPGLEKCLASNRRVQAAPPKSAPIEKPAIFNSLGNRISRVSVPPIEPAPIRQRIGHASATPNKKTTV
jgi:acetyltransferase-like isoleucine patch superfamily enzyme